MALTTLRAAVGQLRRNPFWETRYVGDRGQYKCGDYAGVIERVNGFGRKCMQGKQAAGRSMMDIFEYHKDHQPLEPSNRESLGDVRWGQSKTAFRYLNGFCRACHLYR